MRFIAIAITALALVPASGSAQSALHSGTSVVVVPIGSAGTAEQQKGPTIESASVGVRSAHSKTDAAASTRPARHSGLGHGAALMVVGGGAMVAGSFMDGNPHTFFIVGGALVALYGLYLLVQ